MLGFNHDQLITRGAIHTATEIAQQPAKWRELARTLQARRAEIQAYLQAPFAHQDLVVVFSGAGTSAYAGAIAAADVMATGPRTATAVPTTDMVDHHACFLDVDKPTLFVSIARSGDSPESLTARAIVDKHFKRAWHVVLTCNERGRLARAARSDNQLCLVMPDGTNDLGFAMTSSFSCLLIAALAIFEDDGAGGSSERIEQVADLAEAVIDRSDWIEKLAREDHDRAVYLGSGALKPAAAESALKLLELTDGEVATSSESPLAFRHGPKAIINGRKTLVVGYINRLSPSSSYSLDMLSEIRDDGKAEVVVVGPAEASGQRGFRSFPVEAGSAGFSDGWLAVVYVTFAQLLGLFKSLHLGHQPDSPCPSGEINRVVQNVTIY